VVQKRYVSALVLTTLLMILATSAGAQTQMNLTVEEVRSLALQHNRSYLQAEEEVAKAKGDIGRAQSGALPQITLNSGYTRNFKTASQFVTIDGETSEFKFGFENTFGWSLQAYQPVWTGGRVWSAYAIAKQYRKFSEAGSDQVAANVIYQSELLFHEAILAKSRLEVLQKSLETFEHNVKMVEKHYSQGMVSKFELLRARVEKSNLEPQILAAESEVRLSQKRLKSFLGLDLDQPVSLTEGDLDTSLARVPSLSELTQKAIDQRPEMAQADLMVDMRRRAIKVASANYWPSVGLVSQYDWNSVSDDFTVDGNISRSFTAGVNLTWNLFDGFLTRSEVGIAKADHRQANYARLDALDAVKLEVEQAYDQLIQAGKSLDARQETIEQAEEGLRIANLRYETGEGTLLEVLSAQTALTQARTALAEANFGFRAARAGLRKATAMEI